MGNASSALGIQLDQPAIYSGGTVSGKVFMQVTKETTADTLQIKLVGKEHSHVHWTTTRTRGSGDNRRSETVHHHAYANRVLVQIDVPLCRFPSGKVAPGNYEFPFSATMPPGLPTSMAAYGGGGDCRISYQLKARLHRPGMFKPDATATRSIIVQSTPLPPMPQPFYAPPQTVKVKWCCCFDQGQIHLGAGVDDTLLGRGQQVGVGIAIQNESSSKLESVTVHIQEFVTWWASGHRNKSNRTIAFTEWDLSAMGGLEEQSKASLKAREGDTREARAMTLEALAATLLAGQQREMLTVAADARDSYVGSCLSTSHRCYVTSKTPCCVTDPQLELPVRIGTLPLSQPLPTSNAEGTVVSPTMVAAAYPAPPPLVMAEAVPLDEDEQRAITAVPTDWSGVIVADAVVLPMGDAAVGGAMHEGGERQAEPEEDGDVPTASTPAAASLHAEGTMGALKERMDNTCNDLAMLSELLGRPESGGTWRPLLTSLSPEDFGMVVGEVNLVFDQPTVAELLGKQLRGGVTAEHIIWANRKAAQQQRPAIVKKLAPLCIDLPENVTAIEAGLSEWDRILTKRVLRPA